MQPSRFERTSDERASSSKPIPSAVLSLRAPRAVTSATEVTYLIDRRTITLLRASLGVVFLWFGVLKFFPNASPAEDLAGRTLTVISLGLLPRAIGVPLLAGFESAIGVLLLCNRAPRFALAMLLLHMAGTAVPLVAFPAEIFRHVPFVLTMEGQYILKNVIIATAALALRSVHPSRSTERNFR